MAAVPLTPALRQEYENLFNTCVVRPDRAAQVEQIVARILQNKARYEAVGRPAGIPWPFIAVIHNMESGLSFSGHLHNGDPLKKRTIHVPAGRPAAGTPPFTWEQSAADALAMKGLNARTDWRLAGMIYQIERYNGWGYRLYHRHVLSPYVWSFSNHYKSGKYVADGTWSDSAVSQQCGAAVLLRRMAERGEIPFSDQPSPELTGAPLVVAYAMTKSAVKEEYDKAVRLQEWLNTYPGIFVRVDGVPGKNTSEAFKKVVGSYLPGDPRTQP